MMPLLRSAARHASRTNELPALLGVGRRNGHRISPALDAPGCVLRLDASTDASSLCVLAPNGECSEIYCRYFYDPPLVPRPVTFAALRTARPASGCVPRPRRIYRCAFVLRPCQRRPCLAPSSSPTSPARAPGNGGTEDKASGDDPGGEMSGMHCSTVP